VHPLQVDNVIRKFSNTALDADDTQDLISDLQKQDGAFVRFTLDSQLCLRSLYWATAEQVHAAHVELQGNVHMWHTHISHLLYGV
jgi:hypothetical protein